MPIIKCSNDECGQNIEFNLSQLDIEESQPSGNHTTQHSGSSVIECGDCGTETEVNCVWDELDDTGEVLSIHTR